jgi:hypothetical protein
MAAVEEKLITSTLRSGGDHNPKERPTFRLEVSMDYAPVVEILYGFHYFCYIELGCEHIASFGLDACVKFFVLFEANEAQQFPSWRQIHAHIQVSRILEREIESDDDTMAHYYTVIPQLATT